MKNIPIPRVTEKLVEGANKVCNAVKRTFGPTSGYVLIDKMGSMPVATKDGVTVAKDISLPDKVEDIAAQLIKQASAKTVDDAGDGTTTSAILSQFLVNEGHRLVKQGYMPMLMRKGMEKALKDVVEELQKISTPVKENKEILKNIAYTACNGNENISNMIYDIYGKLGFNASVTVSTSRLHKTRYNIVKGVFIDKGVFSDYFFNAKGKCVFKNPYILVFNERLTEKESVYKILEWIHKDKSRSLLIITEEISGEALQFVAAARVSGNMPICVTKAPSFSKRKRDTMEDIAVLTGATSISYQKNIDLMSVDPESILGRADEIEVTERKCIIVGYRGDKNKIEERVQEIRQNESENDNSKYNKGVYDERISQLIGGVASIVVGGDTEPAISEEEDRVIDAVLATRSAIQEGYVPGAGSAYIEVFQQLSKTTSNEFKEKYRKSLNSATYTNNKLKTTEESIKAGYDLVLWSLLAPTKQLIINSGIEDEKQITDFLHQCTQRRLGKGYNPLTYSIEDLEKNNIVDPTKVLRCAITNAVSVAGILITTNTAIVNVSERKDFFDPMRSYSGEAEDTDFQHQDYNN